MNHWLQLSIEYANQRSYLDDLFQVYPLAPEGIRDIDKELWGNVERAFKKHDNRELFQNLIKLKLFPIKDSYVAFLKKDKTAITRNPKTVNRLSGRLYEMGLQKIFERASKPKETNRQIGPLFRNWIMKQSLGIAPVRVNEFIGTKKNAILDAHDAELMAFAREHLNYRGEKGLDFIGRFNGKYVIGEAKFLTDFGGHQNAQFTDGVQIVRSKGVSAVPVSILDGVLYLKKRSKMHKTITGQLKDTNIMSALVLRDFLYQL